VQLPQQSVLVASTAIKTLLNVKYVQQATIAWKVHPIQLHVMLALSVVVTKVYVHNAHQAIIVLSKLQNQLFVKHHITV
jgi:hypothetical protein